MSLQTPSQSVSHKRFHQYLNHKRKLSLRHPLPTFGSFSFFQASLWFGVDKVLQKLTKSYKSELRHLFQCSILIPRKCPRKTPFQHTVPPPLRFWQISYPCVNQGEYYYSPLPYFQTFLRPCTVTRKIMLQSLMMEYIMGGLKVKSTETISLNEFSNLNPVSSINDIRGFSWGKIDSYLIILSYFCDSNNSKGFYIQR